MNGSSGKRTNHRRSPAGLASLAAFVTRRPRFAVGAWIGLMLVLGVLGYNLGNRLEAHPIYVGEAQRAHEIALRKFGSDESMVVVLRGPRAAVNRQGRRLVAAIEALPNTLALSPWTADTPIEGLRPRPGVAGIVVRVGRRPDEAFVHTLELVEGQIDKTVSAPVDASVAGLPKVFTGIKEASENAVTKGELIALPILLIVLLLVFRSVLAALIPVVSGAIVVAGAQGVMRLLLGVFTIDIFSLGVMATMGLALGVDYSLLVVSRFREERHKGDLPSAARVTVEATGRSIVPAGFGLVLALLVAAQFFPGAAIHSSALGVAVATLLSVFSALWLAPALLLLLGDNLDRWSLPRRFASRGAPVRLARRISRSPFAVGAVVLAVLVLAALAATLNSAVATPELLPSDSSARVDGEEVERSLGPGWLAPIEVLVDGRGAPMTSPDRLHSLVAFQKRVERDSGVQTMMGFSDIERAVKPLSGFEKQLADQNRGASRLSGGLARAGAAAGGDRLYEASAGAGRLGFGAQASAAGAGQLARGLGVAHAGSSQLSQGLRKASTGSGRLASNSSDVSSGAGRLAEALAGTRKQVVEMSGTVRATKNAMRLGEERLATARGPLESAEARLDAAWQAIQRMTTGASDPEYASARSAVKEAIESLGGAEPESEGPADSTGGVGAGIDRAQRQFDLGLYLAGKIGESNSEASTNAGKLADASRKLDHGVERLAKGTRQMSEGVSRLRGAGERLSPALQRLTEGTASLESGLGRLGVKAGALAAGLASGAQGQESLAATLRRMGSRLGAQSEDGNSQLDRLRRQSPGLFDSGYFYLAGLDGADKRRRSRASLMIDLAQGGHAARMLVIPRSSVAVPQGKETLTRVTHDARALADETGANVAVGGLAATQVGVDHLLRDRTALARIALMLISLIVLIPVLRSLIVPIIAMFVNLLTVSASLGVLALAFNHSLLGGPGYVDSIVIFSVVMVTFGLAIDYEVFIFARMREEYVRTGSSQAGIQNGLSQTAPVVTGAALIMIAVFLSFSLSSFATLRQLGVALAAAAFIDAFFVRLIIVPTIMRALGKWAWWMPGWLDRIVPGGKTLPGSERAAG